MNELFFSSLSFHTPLLMKLLNDTHNHDVLLKVNVVLYLLFVNISKKISYMREIFAKLHIASKTIL